MMAGRAVAVVAAALTYHVSLWLAIAFLVAGAILPWSAVILANDGPPRRGSHPGYAGGSGERSLSASDRQDRTVDG